MKFDGNKSALFEIWAHETIQSFVSKLGIAPLSEETEDQLSIALETHMRLAYVMGTIDWNDYSFYGATERKQETQSQVELEREHKRFHAFMAENYPDFAAKLPAPRIADPADQIKSLNDSLDKYVSGDVGVDTEKLAAMREAAQVSKDRAGSTANYGLLKKMLTGFTYGLGESVANKKLPTDAELKAHKIAMKAKARAAKRKK